MRKVNVIIILLIVSLLPGCGLFYSVEPYTFRQDASQIVKIEILKQQYDSSDPYTPTDVLLTLDEDQYEILINEILLLDGGRCGLDPPTGFGRFIIKIYYIDGEIEIIGPYNNGYISPEGKLRQDCYGFDQEQFYDLISSYLGEKVDDLLGA